MSKQLKQKNRFEKLDLDFLHNQKNLNLNIYLVSLYLKSSQQQKSFYSFASFQFYGYFLKIINLRHFVGFALIWWHFANGGWLTKRSTSYEDLQTAQPKTGSTWDSRRLYNCSDTYDNRNSSQSPLQRAFSDN